MLDTAGKADKAGIFNNAAQVWNHTLYWNSMRQPFVQRTSGEWRPDPNEPKVDRKRKPEGVRFTREDANALIGRIDETIKLTRQLLSDVTSQAPGERQTLGAPTVTAAVPVSSSGMSLIVINKQEMSPGQQTAGAPYFEKFRPKPKPKR